MLLPSGVPMLYQTRTGALNALHYERTCYHESNVLPELIWTQSMIGTAYGNNYNGFRGKTADGSEEWVLLPVKMGD